MATSPASKIRESIETLQPFLPEGAGAVAAAPHLLIVDDVDDNRAVLARRFMRRGFQISEANCGRQALDMVATTDFDMVLLDVMMPDIDGVEVLREIRKTRSSAVLPVIMVTARSQSDDIVQALDCGADDYITKPVDFAVALARVNTQVARRNAEMKVVLAAKALQANNEELELRVEERTSELVKLNESLRKEITQREKSEEKSRYLAHHDALTGLANRVLFREALENEMASVVPGKKALGLLFVDLDGFKSVNDTLGHSVGDALLKCLSIRLRDLLSEHDHIARLGGDEFAILQVNCPQPHSASVLASAIIDSMSEVCQLGDHEVTVGASVGIAICESNDIDATDLLRNADLAMYRAKMEGRGTYRLFDPEMDEMAQARRQLELDMRRAIAVGDFHAHFQPIIDIGSRKIVCFEALMRWNHPTRGDVPPTEFIPVAEETGMIVQIGEWIIRTACAEAATWPGTVRVAVNLSPVQFVRGNIVSSVVNALAASGLPGTRLELEITESVILERSERNVAILNQLRSLGVRISMDDFGTGYSSLSYLRSFRFDKIKIDQSFVRDMHSGTEGRAIVGAIASLGTCFGMNTTAEGVETREQLELVVNEGCSEVQGRFFSMPVPSSEVLRLITDFGQHEAAGSDAEKSAA